jgi:hypothetical protein
MYVVRRNTAELVQLTEYTKEILDMLQPDALCLRLSCNKEAVLEFWQAWGTYHCSTKADMSDTFPAEILKLQIDVSARNHAGAVVVEERAVRSGEVYAAVKQEGKHSEFAAVWVVNFSHPGFDPVIDRIEW